MRDEGKMEWRGKGGEEGEEEAGAPTQMIRSGPKLREVRSEEIIERICNQSGHCERHKDVLWNQERRKMFHIASRRVYLREVYLRKPHTSRSDAFQADVKGRKPISPESRQPEDPIIG